MAAPKRTELSDWEHIRFFLELYRRGSLSAAARALGVDHTTVARRIASLEGSLGVRLFDRTARGYERTLAADELLPLAEVVEQSVHALERRVESGDMDLVGVVRITTTDHLIASFLAPALPDFVAQHPGIIVEAIADNRDLSLPKREADVALRLGRPQDEGLVARKLVDVAYAFYGPRGVERRSPSVDFDADRFVGYDDSLAHIPEESWLAKLAPARRVVFRTTTLHSLQAAVRAGLGVGLLPRFVGQVDAELEELACEHALPSRELFLLTHAELRRSPRVRAVLDFIVERAAANHRLFAGDV